MSEQNQNPKDQKPETQEESIQNPLTPEPEVPYFQDMMEETATEDGRVAELEAALAETKDQMLRAVAEAENTRKRLLREREDVRKYAVSDFARDLLEFSDNFGRALASIPEEAKNDALLQNVLTGIETMEKELLRTMEKHGIQKMEPMGEPFNPNFHEAMFEAPGTGQPAGTIIELIEPGYLLHDRLLRPARVGIAKDEGTSSGHSGDRIDTEA